MAGAAPAEVLVQDAVHAVHVAGEELEGGGEHDVAAVVKHRVVVAELHVVGVDRLALPLLREDVARGEELGDEHRALALRGGREEVQVLPDRAAHGARDADEVLEPRPAALDGLEDEVLHHGAALHPEPPVVVEPEVARAVSDDEPAVAAVADEDVRAEAEDEVRDLELARGGDGGREVVGAGGRVEQVGRTPDAKSGVLAERLVPLEAARVEAGGERVVDGLGRQRRCGGHVGGVGAGAFGCVQAFRRRLRGWSRIDRVQPRALLGRAERSFVGVT